MDLQGMEMIMAVSAAKVEIVLHNGDKAPLEDLPARIPMTLWKDLLLIHMG